MPAPVAAAMTSDAPSATSLITGSTGSLIGWPLIRIGRPASSPSRAGFSARNEPYRMRNVTTAKPRKTAARRLSVVQKTSEKPSESNQSAST